MEISDTDRNILRTGDHIPLHRNDITRKVLHQFMGFKRESKVVSRNVTDVKRTISSLTKLDDYIATNLICSQDDGLEKVRDHRQTVCRDSLSFVPLAHSELDWCFTKLCQRMVSWAFKP